MSADQSLTRKTLGFAAIRSISGHSQFRPLQLVARVFHYDALEDGERFQARLDTDEFGRVLLYEGL